MCVTSLIADEPKWIAATARERLIHYLSDFENMLLSKVDRRMISSQDRNTVKSVNERTVLHNNPAAPSRCQVHASYISAY